MIIPGFREAAWQPPADIYRTPHGWLVKYDLAGVSADEVSLDVVGDKLTLSGTRRDSVIEEGLLHHHLEISYSHFQRTLSFPISLKEARISVEQREGMLLVRINAE